MATWELMAKLFNSRELVSTAYARKVLRKNAAWPDLNKLMNAKLIYRVKRGWYAPVD